MSDLRGVGVQWWIDRAVEAERERDKLREQLVKLKRSAAELCDQIEVDEEHGGGADETDCPICEAIRDVRAALTDEKGKPHA